jgi:CheY-like chemotaxis protein
VLVVDDEAIARDVVTKYLQSDGHRVSTACSGDEAIIKLRETDYDLLLTDHAMPGMSGVQLGAITPRDRRLAAVILLTGHSFAPGEEPEWVDSVVSKPIPPDVLRRAMVEVMGR